MSELREKDYECPSDDFEHGDSSGSCWGDGHYKCLECNNYRPDFKQHGQELIDFAHTSQSGLIFKSL